MIFDRVCITCKEEIKLHRHDLSCMVWVNRRTGELNCSIDLAQMIRRCSCGKVHHTFCKHKCERSKGDTPGSSPTPNVSPESC